VSNRLMWRRRRSCWHERPRRFLQLRNARLREVISAPPMGGMTTFAEVPRKVVLVTCGVLAWQQSSMV
jgi:hypothetical protein